VRERFLSIVGTCGQGEEGSSELVAKKIKFFENYGSGPQLENI